MNGSRRRCFASADYTGERVHPYEVRRVELGLRQTDLCRMAQVSDRAYSRHINGRSNMLPERTARVERILGLAVASATSANGEPRMTVEDKIRNELRQRVIDAARDVFSFPTTKTKHSERMGTLGRAVKQLNEYEASSSPQS